MQYFQQNLSKEIEIFSYTFELGIKISLTLLTSDPKYTLMML